MGLLKISGDKTTIQLEQHLEDSFNQHFREQGQNTLVMPLGQPIFQ